MLSTEVNSTAHTMYNCLSHIKTQYIIYSFSPIYFPLFVAVMLFLHPRHPCLIERMNIINELFLIP